MAPNKFATMLHKKTNKMTVILIYVVLEWTLISFLLLNSLFSYFILKFARYFGLKPPCFLCSRLDHLLENQPTKTPSFAHLICDQHAAELSTIGYCSHHRKLVESHNMCLSCSSSTPSDHQVVKDPDEKIRCSCCDVMIITGRESCGLDDHEKGDHIVINQRNQIGCDVGLEAEDKSHSKNLCNDLLLPQHLDFYIDHDDYRLIPIELVDEDDDDSVKVVRKGEVSGHEQVSKELEFVLEGYELVSGYEIKNLPNIIEEEESLPGHEQGEEASSHEQFFEQLELVLEGDELVSGCDIKNLPSLEEEEESLAVDDNLQIEQDRDHEVENSLKFQEPIEGNETENLQGKEEIDVEDNPILQGQMAAEIPSNSVSKEDIASELRVADDTDAERNHDLIVEETTTPCKSESHTVTDSIACEVSSSSSHLPSIQEHVSKEDIASDLRVADDTDAERNHDLIVEETTTPCKRESHTIPDHVVCEVSSSSGHLPSVQEHEGEQTEGEAEAGTCRGCTYAEITVTEADRVPDTPTSVESLHNLHKKIMLLGRKESATEESLDGSIISEVEGGDGGVTIEKLRTELQAERKALRALYAELEEERNASAIAANQTMAMINRLQEEKATMQMEALQYQRMMEEQSEYDQEALQMMNELMVKREKEKQEFEKELEVYRKKVMDYEEKEKIRMLSRRSLRSRNSSASCSYGEESDGLSIDLNHEGKDQEEDSTSRHSHEENGHRDTPSDAVLSLQDSLATFEEERQAILEQLKVLEEKLFTLTEEEEEHIENMKPFEQICEENGKDFENGGDNGFCHVNGKHQEERRMNGSMPKTLLPLFDATELLDSPEGEFDGFDSLILENSPMAKFELDKKRVAIEQEVDHVYERLQALEADREFLKHCVGSLRKGDKGLDLLHEILQHLRDLKNVELQVMKNMDHCASV